MGLIWLHPRASFIVTPAIGLAVLCSVVYYHTHPYVLWSSLPQLPLSKAHTCTGYLVLTQPWSSLFILHCHILPSHPSDSPYSIPLLLDEALVAVSCSRVKIVAR